MTDWAWDLVNGPGTLVPLNSEPELLAGKWKYSGVIDWFDNLKSPYGPGFLPALMNKDVKSVIAGSGGLYGSDYKVNNQYIFIGLNPTFPKKTHGIAPNKGNFTGFNMESATNLKSYETNSTLADFWKLCGLISNHPVLNCLYSHFKGTYMTDVGLSEEMGNSEDAERNIISTQLIHFGILFNELMIYKKYIHPAKEQFKNFKICALGQQAFDQLVCFSHNYTNPATKQTAHDLFPGAEIYRVRHFAHGGSVHLVQNLIAIYNLYPSISLISNPLFPELPILPIDIKTW